MLENMQENMLFSEGKIATMLLFTVYFIPYSKFHDCLRNLKNMS